MLYLFIFIAKFIEVCLATIRVVLINRGEKFKGSAIGFFEILIWIYVVSEVLPDVAKYPLKVLAYALAFTCGNYFGVIIENKLAIGTACIQALIKDEVKEDAIRTLRDKGFGVTVLKGKGKDGDVSILMVYLKRKRLDVATMAINEYYPDAMIIVNDVRKLKNGYIKK